MPTSFEVHPFLPFYLFYVPPKMEKIYYGIGSIIETTCGGLNKHYAGLPRRAIHQRLLSSCCLLGLQYVQQVCRISQFFPHSIGNKDFLECYLLKETVKSRRMQKAFGYHPKVNDFSMILLITIS